MQIRRFVFAAAALAATTTSVSAQRRGTVEVGGFGQLTRTDAPWALKNSIGFGGRVGLFLSPRWELEADASTTSFDPESPRVTTASITGKTYAGRLTLNLPFGNPDRPHHFLLGVGAGGQSVDGHQDFSFSPGLGMRLRMGRRVALRVDALTEFVENPTALEFGFPPVPAGVGVTVNPKAARSTNVAVRAGVSLFFGLKPAEPPPPPPPPPPAPRPVAPPPTAPPPAPPVAPPPAAPRPVAPPPAAPPPVDRRPILLQKIYFDFDKSDIRADQRATLDAMVPVLRDNAAVRIRIEGHADERGSDEYNMALGMRRAQQAKQYLVDQGIAASRVDITSFGEERPVCQEKDESCWSRNRRDETVIVAGGDAIR